MGILGMKVSCMNFCLPSLIDISVISIHSLLTLSLLVI